jgi:hypothetical protein
MYLISEICVQFVYLSDLGCRQTNVWRPPMSMHFPVCAPFVQVTSLFALCMSADLSITPNEVTSLYNQL